ncbi:hypothetical protein ARTHRO9V_230169 [Arthrobacter sp. 9V]|nr:hypothetical protein ARTHRO9V_230169 [Arthrobacter sp. 9V]
MRVAKLEFPPWSLSDRGVVFMTHVSENPYKSALLTVEFRPGNATPQRPANPKGLNMLWPMLFSTLQLVPVAVKFASVVCCFMRRKSLLRVCALSVLTAFLLGSSISPSRRMCRIRCLPPSRSEEKSLIWRSMKRAVPYTSSRGRFR